MRKIKNFKIPIYTYDILRRARKHRLDLASAGLADENAAKEYIAGLASALEPSTVFTRLDQPDPIAAKISGRAGSRMTAGALTLGASFENRLAQTGEATLRRLERIAGSIFLETGVNVVKDLLGGETEPEGFELEDPVYIHSSPPQETAAPIAPTSVPLFENELIKELFERLETGKIGVSFESGVFIPKYLAVFVIPWISKKKKKAEQKKAAAK
ncbi:MAG: hypothetical protein A2021_00950 [Elusimicrobia bacterium GWF2_52_66]|nr:MAG: hypothetical protein A2X33_06635 [Elusimicrobia bacterium GWA2_51_34]OGR88161.1 MAG: hypothetical protein A2021_00950 [Elusimicrobia bacterium GWF2_52_66]HAF95364.1 hypothetical protein [Elusimicrobiota bacterium]HCE98772.1 hypothetical protein [Elusimicrobiota bacterium]